MPTKKQATKRLQFSRHFTKEGVSPFDMFEYDYRTSVIKNPTGEVVFQMDNVEVPKAWSQIATDILAQKYFRLTPLTEIDYQLKLESQKLERLRKRQKKVNDIAEHLKSLGIIKTI